MKTINTIKTQWKKAVVVGALTLAPALSLTNSAQAAPRQEFRNSAPSWSNQRRDDNRRDNNWNQGRGHFDQRPGNGRDFGRNDYRNEYRNDHRYDHNRRDHRRDDDKKSNTGKIIGAGIVGAILGAVLSR